MNAFANWKRRPETIRQLPIEKAAQAMLRGSSALRFPILRGSELNHQEETIDRHATRHHRQPERETGGAHQADSRDDGIGEVRGRVFFLSGLEAIEEKLSGVKRLRLLIRNTSSRETIEQISEGTSG